MHVIERTDAFTLVGADARRGKLTLFEAEGPRERGALEHVALRVSDLERALAGFRTASRSSGRATARRTSSWAKASRSASSRRTRTSSTTSTMSPCVSADPQATAGEYGSLGFGAAAPGSG